MVKILETAKTKTIILADGKEYELPALNLTTLANVEKTMGFSLNKFASKVDEAAMTTMRLCAYAFLKERSPQLTLEEAGSLIGLKEMDALSEYFSVILAMAG